MFFMFSSKVLIWLRIKASLAELSTMVFFHMLRKPQPKPNEVCHLPKPVRETPVKKKRGYDMEASLCWYTAIQQQSDW